MACRDSEDEIWSRFVFELVIRTQPSGPLCLWQCLPLTEYWPLNDWWYHFLVFEKILNTDRDNAQNTEDQPTWKKWLGRLKLMQPLSWHFQYNGRGDALFGHLYLSIFRYKEYQVSDARWANYIWRLLLDLKWFNLTKDFWAIRLHIKDHLRYKVFH